MSSNKPFGSVFSSQMGSATYSAGSYSSNGVHELQPLQLHPGSHVLHYSSTCFEGMKAHKGLDGSVAIFRLDDHVERFVHSITQLQVTPPEPALLHELVTATVAANAADTPEQPGSLYVRPAFIGTTENVGAAAAAPTDATLFVICSPVGDYFAGGIRPLTLLVETELPRTTSQFGRIKSGANYVMALGPTLAAKRDHGADQVLFANNNDVTETGAANFILVNDSEVITRHLDTSFLHGVTRRSILQIAETLGYTVREQAITVDDLKNWDGEAFLTGTAAVVAPVGKLLIGGEELVLGDGNPGPNTLKLRDALTSIQAGKEPDTFGWLTKVADS